MAEIGFIGLGNMGGPMAVNLVKAGHTVRGFDVSKETLEKAQKAGILATNDLLTAINGAEIVITMLPAGRHVKSVYCDDHGLIGSVGTETLLIDCSTIDVETSRHVAAQADATGLLMVDAPVSGGVGGAEAGTLTFMVGGCDAAFAKAEPYLQIMGKNIIHAGGAGNGQAAKICNNMILGVTMIAVSEAFVLAEKLGLDKQKLFDISSTASGQCWALTSYCPVPGPLPASPANRDYQPGFTVAMMLKDLCLAQDAANASGATTPLGAAAMTLYTQFDEAGKSQLDFSAIVKHIRKDAADLKQ